MTVVTLNLSHSEIIDNKVYVVRKMRYIFKNGLAQSQATSNVTEILTLNRIKNQFKIMRVSSDWFIHYHDK